VILEKQRKKDKKMPSFAKCLVNALITMGYKGRVK